MKVAFGANRHARSILFLLFALVVGGVVGTLVIPVSLFPRVNFPRIRVHLDAGERPAERMVVEVTRPVEEALRAVPGIRRINSSTSRGSAELWMSFDWGDDMTVALLQAESQINKVLTTLPAGTTFEIRRMDPTVFPVIAYSLTSDTLTLTQLRDLAQYQLRPLLTPLNGVARIGVAGGEQEEYRVVVDPAQLAAHNLGLADISAALAAANLQNVVGRVQDRYKLDLVVTDSRFQSANDVADAVLRSGAGGIVRLRDVASVKRDVAPEFSIVTADGRRAVQLDVFQQPGGNTVDIARSIRAALDAERTHLPGVRMICWYDQSDLINDSAHSVRDAVLIGVILAALVLLLFLRNWRITLVAALTVPIVLTITSLLLYLLGQSFNIMTLGGMAAAVGLIIDDAIVMCEHIIRRLHASSAGDAEQRVLNAADEFSKPLTGSSLSTIIIHIPPAFMIGVIGAFFGALSLSMASSLVVSFLVAWLVIPILAARFLRGHRVQQLPTEMPQHQRRIYPRLLGPVLRRPWMVLLIMLPMLAVGYLAYTHLASGFMPVIDEGGFVIDYVGPSGTSLPEMDRMLKKVEAILHDTPEVLAYSRRTGFGLGEDLSEANMGDFFVRLKPFPRRPLQDVMDEVEQKIHHTVPALDIDPLQLMEDLIGDLTGRPEPIVVNLFSEDEATLRQTARNVADALAKVPDVDEVKDGLIPAGDSLDVQIDRVKASLEGVDSDTVSRGLAELLSGTVTTQIQQGDKLIDVRVWTPANLRKTTRDIETLPLRAPDGHLFPAGRVATFKMILGEPEITREDLKRVIAVSGRSNRDLGSTIRDVQALLNQPGLVPVGVRYSLGGLYEQQQLAFHGLVQVIIAGAILVFLLLLFLYESFRVASAILLTTVLAMTAVFIGLWVTHTELNISSLMGMVMIVGNVTEVAIFYYSEYIDFPTPGSTHERLIEAGRFRMRAIAMTTIAAIFALLPLALGIGHGSAMLQPLAIAIIAGLTVQLPLVLVIFPGLLALMRNK